MIPTKELFIVHLIIQVSCLLLMGLGLLFPTASYEGATRGLTLFLTVLIPYLLPFLTLSKLFMFLHSKKDKPIRPLWLYILSSIGGYPTGAALLKQTMQRQTIQRPGLLFSALQFPSPMFLIGFIGAGIFYDIRLGITFFLLLHVINGTLFFYWVKKQSTIAGVVQKAKRPTSSFFLSLAETLTTIAVSVIVSSACAEVIAEMFSFSGTGRVLSYGLLELSSGIGLLNTSVEDVYLCAFFLGFSGMSVHLQNILLLRGEAISFIPYWFSRLLTILVLWLFIYLFI
ncbi:hypothetical protein ACFO0S_04590 [Chryseomicrobium palamuruense]|uniref:Sporulation integral membrane protein YlbJ n=1 Tax=Chryseomicrobium palamuruense TaxID=682973 RepID=A0ABV8USU4_9BACL